MRIENIDVKLTIPIPIGKPDKNGVIFSEQAIEKAVTTFYKNLPIIYRDNENAQNGVVIGHTVGDTHIVTWDDEHQVCRVTVDGVVHFGGAECSVNKIENGEIKDFQIVGFGISM